MGLKGADFNKCTKKKKCCDTGIIYDPTDPCHDPERERFNAKKCTCEPLYPRNFAIDIWFNSCSLGFVRNCHTLNPENLGDALCSAPPDQGGQFNQELLSGTYWGMRLEVVKDYTTVPCCFPRQRYAFIPAFVQVTAQKEFDGPWEPIGQTSYYGRPCGTNSRTKVISQWYVNYFYEDGVLKDPVVVQSSNADGLNGGWDSIIQE